MPTTSIVIYVDVRYAERLYSFFQDVRKVRLSYRGRAKRRLSYP